MEERTVFVVSDGCSWHKYDVYITSVRYRSQLRWQFHFREEPTAELCGFP